MPFKKKIDLDGLTNRINRWNTTQQIKKHELGLLPNIWSAENVGMFRQRFYALQGNETALDQVSREQIVRLSRELFFKLPGIGVASELKANYVVGKHWDFVYKGSNQDWGKKAQDWINNYWFNNCNTRGRAFDWRTNLRVLSRTLDMDGDVLMLYVINKHKWPLLQFVGSHRVGTASANMAGKDALRVTFKGKEYRCLDGVVYDDNFTPIAYSIKRDDAQIATVPPDPKIPSQDTLVSVENGCLIFNPLVFDKGRGLPALYSSVLHGLQLDDLNRFLLEIAKLEATIAYVIKNDMGQAPQEYENLLNQIQAASGGNNLTSIPAMEPTVHGVSVVKTPNINYVKAEGGELQSFRSQRPSEEIQQYMKTIECKLLSAIGIPSQMIYDPESISGRAVNAVTAMVLKSVSERQTLMKKHATTAVAYALACGMEEGYIPKNYKEDLGQVIDFTLPPEFRLDSNNDNKVNLELWKAGLISGEEYCRENDSDYVSTQARRKVETRQILQDVEDLKKEFPDQDSAVILNLITQKGNSTLAITEQSAPQPSNTQE
jgi:hypothetical protein